MAETAKQLVIGASFHHPCDPGKILGPPIDGNVLQAPSIEDEVEMVVAEGQLGGVADNEMGRRFLPFGGGDGTADFRPGEIDAHDDREIPRQQDGQIARPTAEIRGATPGHVRMLEQRLDPIWQAMYLPSEIMTGTGFIGSLPLRSARRRASQRESFIAGNQFRRLCAK